MTDKQDEPKEKTTSSLPSLVNLSIDQENTNGQIKMSDSSLDIINSNDTLIASTSANSVFNAPSLVSTDSLSNSPLSNSSANLNHLINTFSPPSSSSNLTTLDNNSNKSIVNSNKITLIPLNLNNTLSTGFKIASSGPGSTTPVKFLTDSSNNTKTILSPISNPKKLIINTTSLLNNSETGITTTSAAKIGQQTITLAKPGGALNTNRPIGTGGIATTATGAKIFTISTHNNNQLHQLNKPLSANLINTSNNLSQNASGNNKIQYVKIVNTNNNATSQLQIQPQTATVGAGATSKQIKITTITTNTNTNAITTTTTNNNNNSANTQNSEVNSTNTLNRSLSNILSTLNQKNVDSTGQQTQSTQLPTSVLYEAINSNGQTPLMPPSTTSSTTSTTTSSLSTNTNPLLKLHTYQLVNTTASSNPISTQQQKITTTTKTPLIQRIQSINQYTSNQPITKTIVSASSSSLPFQSQAAGVINSCNSGASSDRTSNYKVLTQQLPINTNFQNKSSLFSSNTGIGNNTNGSQFSITKTTNNYPSEDLGNNNKQIITNVRNDSLLANTVRSSNESSSVKTLTTNITFKTTTPLTISTANLNSNSNNPQFGLEINSKNCSTSPSKQAGNFSASGGNNNKTFQTSQNLNKTNQSNEQIKNQLESLTSPPISSSNQINSSSNNRKPCNCTKSMCLKLYCDCFAIGSFCHDCNCINCFNTLEHEDERNKAIKMVLDRNPQAFQSKIGKFTAQVTLSKVVPAANEPVVVAATIAEDIDEIQSRHIKGCNCKKSNCLKRYCECYLAKIQCSTLCKCVGCKNCDESTKTLLQLANAADMRKQQQQYNHIQHMHNQNYQFNNLSGNHGKFMSNQFQYSSKSDSSSKPLAFWRSNSFKQNELDAKFNIFNCSDLISKQTQEQLKLEQQKNLNNSYATLTNEAIEITCSRLIERVAEELDRLKQSADDEEMNEENEDSIANNLNENENESKYDEKMESLLIEEFGRCLVDIIETAEKRN